MPDSRQSIVEAAITAVKQKFGEEAFNQLDAKCLQDISVSTAMLVDGGMGGGPIDDDAGAGDTDKTWSADKIVSEITQIIVSGGVPIDDTAGEGDTDKIWSAARSWAAESAKVDKAGKDQVLPDNCSFMLHSPNLFNKNVLETGLLNKNSGAVLGNYTTYRTSDWIPVEASADYVMSSSATSHPYYCFYKSDKTYISGAEASMSGPLALSAPQNAAFFRFSMTAEQVTKDVQFEKGTAATIYTPFGMGFIKPEYLSIPGAFPLNVPAKMYADLNTEMNVYFDNIADGHDTDYEWNVDGSVGMQLARGFRIVPTAAGTYTVRFTATRKKDNSQVMKAISLVVPSATAGSGVTKSILVLGDSTTDGGTVISKIHENLDGSGFTVDAYGTRGTAPNKHEGRSGWKISDYCTKASLSSLTNPFYNPSTESFDAGYYFTNTGVGKPDYFVINLGLNDLFSVDKDTDLETKIEETIGYYDDVIASVKAASPGTKLVVALTIPPNYSQDAFGSGYGCGQTRTRYKKNNAYWVSRLIAEYDGRESEGIYILPINAALDTVYNMGFETVPVNARNPEIVYSRPIGNGGVHPVTSGYWQIADVYTAFLKANA